jgi:hypothetical protein
MTPVQLNIYFVVCGALMGALIAILALNTRHAKRLLLARKFSFEAGANLSSETLRRKQGEAYHEGFRDGIYLEEIEETIEEIEWEREERMAQLAEESQNWENETEFYPFESGCF